MALSGLRLCARALPSRGKRGPPPIAARGPPTIASSPAAEHRPQTRRPSNCSPRAQPLRGTRDPPRPGPEPASPAPAGRPPTTAPPGKPYLLFLVICRVLTGCVGRFTLHGHHYLSYWKAYLITFFFLDFIALFFFIFEISFFKLIFVGV